MAQFSISLNISDQKSILRTFYKSDSLNLVCLKPFVPNAPFLIVSLLISPYYPSDIYLVKVNNRNIRASCEIYSKLTIKTPGIVMVSFLISRYYNHQPLLHITQLCNLLFHENFDDFHGACKELKLRIHWRPPTILKSILRTFYKSDSLNLVCLKPFVPNAPFLIVSLLISPYYPSDIYLVKVNNRNIRASCEIYSKLTIKTPGIVMVSFLISRYYNHQPLLHITQLCNLLFHENFDDFHGACKELKLRIHWRPPTILKASKKVYEVMFLVCKSMYILNVYSIH